MSLGDKQKQVTTTEAAYSPHARAAQAAFGEVGATQTGQLTRFLADMDPEEAIARLQATPLQENLERQRFKIAADTYGQTAVDEWMAQKNTSAAQKVHALVSQIESSQKVRYPLAWLGRTAEERGVVEQSLQRRLAEKRKLEGSMLEALTPEERELHRGIFQQQRDVLREELTRQGVELAGRRGLRTSDTPVAGEVLRGATLGLGQIGAQESGSLLGLAQAGREYRNRLYQQALQNRAASFGLFPTGYQASVNTALALAPQRTTGKTSPGFVSSFGGIVGPLGALAGGVGGALKGYSSLQTPQTPQVTTTGTTGGTGGGGGE